MAVFMRNGAAFGGGGGGGGASSHLIILSDEGSTVVITKPDGTTTILPQLISAGRWECDVNEYGAYSISATLESSTKTTSVDVNTATEYTINLPQSGVITVDEVQKFVPITKAEYVALSSAEKNNGVMYQISDMYNDTYPATDIYYNNSVSGLSSHTAQGAIDEISAGIPVYSQTVSCLTGDTTVTIQDSRITTGSLVELIKDTNSDPINITGKTITTGQVVYTFSALTSATTFRVRITNNFNMVGGSAVYLSDLGDVDFETLEDGQSIFYNGSSDKWENKYIGKKIPCPTNNLTSVAYADLAKCGDLVSLSIRGYITGLTSSGMQIATLPEGYRPSTVGKYYADFSAGLQINYQIVTTGQVFAFLTTSGTFTNWINVEIQMVI